MPPPFIFRHAWIMFIAVTCINGAVWWYRARTQIALQPELADGYRRLIRGFLIYGNLPWLVMGLGIVVGGVPSAFHFFNPRNGPWVILWYLSVVALWIAGFVWLFFRHGAEDIVRYPGLLRLPSQNPFVVKLYFLACIAGGIAGLLAMIFGDLHPGGF